MKEFFTEAFYVFAVSRKTQVAFTFGLVFFIGVSLLGEHMVSTLQFSGSVAGLENVIASKLLKQYDKVALGGLASFWLLAVKCYRRDRARFF